MAGFVKQLLLDYTQLSVEQRADIDTAISNLYYSKVISKYDILILEKYLEGYTSMEIAVMLVTGTDKIEMILMRVINAIAFATGYTDEQFIYSLDRMQKFKPTHKQRLKTFLRTYGSIFSTHEPVIV